MKTAKATINKFLAQRRIALVGVSREDKHFSRMVWKDLRARGYDLAAVNPGASEIDGHPCFASIGAVQPPVDGALIMTPPAQSAAVVRACAEAGVRLIWLYRSAGAGSMSPEAVEACQQLGLETVAGECPLMWQRDTPMVHRIHKTLRSWFGSLPA
jgi:predicted CoA-binding protein